MIHLIISAVQAILQVMLIVLAGIIFTAKGYIDDDKQKWLSKLNVAFFTPCLLFSNIASVVSYESLLEYWPIPVFYLLFCIISWALCKFVMPIFGIDRYYRRFILASVMFCNSNSLPIAIISSVSFSEAGKTLFWKLDDDQRSIYARGVSYILLFGLFSNLLRWSVGYSLLQNESEKDVDSYTVKSSYSSSTYGSIITDEINTDIESLIKKTSYNSLDENETKSLHQKVHENKLIALYKTVDKYMSPPLYSALLALIVGLYAPLKELLYNREKFLYNSLTRAIESCGKASVPLVLFCLGSQLKSIRLVHTEHSKKYRTPVSLAVFLRMIVTPIIILPLVYLFGKYGGSWSQLAHDPVFLVSLVVVGCTPTSINLSQITQVSGVFEEEMLSVLFWSYGVVCIPVCTIVVFLALYIVNLA